MVLKGVNCVHNAKIRSYGVKESIGYTLIKAGTQKSGHMVLKGVNWVHIDKIRSNGLERSQSCKQCKNQIIWC